jgi:hypothetical protein
MAHNANDFELLLNAPSLVSKWSALDNSDGWVSRFAAKWFPAIARWKRGTPSDLRENWALAIANYRQGRIHSAPPFHEERFRLEWVATCAILSAAYAATHGRPEAALYFHVAAARVYRRISSDPWIRSPLLEWRGIANSQIIEPRTAKLTGNMFEEIEQQGQNDQYQLLCDLADSLVRNPTRDLTTTEQIFQIVDQSLRDSGYAVGGDLAEAIGLRRRWWLLRHVLGEDLDLSMLVWDIDYWKKQSMNSEVRILASDFERNLRSSQDLRHVLTSGLKGI